MGATDGIGAELCRRRAAKEAHLVIAGRDEAKEELKEVEVEDILERAHRQVRELRTAKKSLLEQMAALLLEKEVLDGEELRQIIGASTSEPRERQSAGA